MKIFFSLFFSIATFWFAIGQSRQQPENTVSVLCIGNQYYPHTRDFEQNVDGVNQSAEKFLECFKPFSTPCLLLSSAEKPLTKSRMLSVIRSFITSVEKQPGKRNLGVIYYCGHGMASQAGSRFFVPGDISVSTVDTTFESLSDKLINIDTIKRVVIDAQTDSTSGHSTQYILIGDCCSEQDFSKWYNGMQYNYKVDSSGNGIHATIKYNDTAIDNNMQRRSVLSESAALTFSSFNDTTKKNALSNGSTEMLSAGELVRGISFNNLGNCVYYSSAMNELTAMVKEPYSTNAKPRVAPICRRTLLYFKGRETSKQFLDEYFRKLTSEDFDSFTHPALLNPSMNATFD